MLQRSNKLLQAGNAVTSSLRRRAATWAPPCLPARSQSASRPSYRPGSAFTGVPVRDTVVASVSTVSTTGGSAVRVTPWSADLSLRLKSSSSRSVAAALARRFEFRIPPRDSSHWHWQALSTLVSPQPQPPSDSEVGRTVTGAGVLIVERSLTASSSSGMHAHTHAHTWSISELATATPLSPASLVLFRRSGYNYYEEPGGGLKPSDGHPIACAARELEEESCGTIAPDVMHRYLQAHVVDIPGRRPTSKYRCFLLEVPGGVLPSAQDYESQREELQKSSSTCGAPGGDQLFIETDGIIRVPLSNLARARPFYNHHYNTCNNAAAASANPTQHMDVMLSGVGVGVATGASTSTPAATAAVVGVSGGGGGSDHHHHHHQRSDHHHHHHHHQHHVHCLEVLDSDGVPRLISARTLKVLQHGGLVRSSGLCQAQAKAAVREAETSSSSS